MKCPVDDTELRMSDRQGVEIDYCPKCRGVWLDRGELDKIIERSEGASAPVPEPSRREESHHSDYRGEHHGDKHKRKKGSFLGDLFEFGD